MNQAVFLITSLNGVQKNRLKRKIKQLLDRNYEIKVVLALVNMSGTRKARELFNQAFKEKQLAKINVQDLSEIFASKPGIALQGDEAVVVDESLTKFEFKMTDQLTATRFIQTGNIKAEKIVNATNGHLVRVTQFNESHQPFRSANYNADGKLISLNYFNQGRLEESQLLNQKGEVTFQFIDQSCQQQLTYSLGSSSVIKLPAAVRLTNDNESNNKVVDSQMEIVSQFSQEVRDFEVLDNETFEQYQDVFKFYVMVLKQCADSNADFYVDMDDNIRLATYLSEQLIFNY